MYNPLESIPPCPDTRLSEYTKDEWRGIAKRASPGLTEEMFEEMWQGFILLKKFKALN